ncbi:hypothetical protein ABZU76_46315 [Amycolatopsis sp. NPDC005232]|uniref:hypothetical protein n=1 Tax=Amycolatopsis sp. NPDC005232 TaxID=3157027 RepID=UPI0033B9A0FA
MTANHLHERARFLSAAPMHPTVGSPSARRPTPRRSPNSSPPIRLREQLDEGHTLTAAARIIGLHTQHLRGLPGGEGRVVRVVEVAEISHPHLVLDESSRSPPLQII